MIDSDHVAAVHISSTDHQNRAVPAELSLFSPPQRLGWNSFRDIKPLQAQKNNWTWANLHIYFMFFPRECLQLSKQTCLSLPSAPPAPGVKGRFIQEHIHKCVLLVVIEEEQQEFIAYSSNHDSNTHIMPAEGQSLTVGV